MIIKRKLFANPPQMTGMMAAAINNKAGALMQHTATLGAASAAKTAAMNSRTSVMRTTANAKKVNDAAKIRVQSASVAKSGQSGPAPAQLYKRPSDPPKPMSMSTSVSVRK